MMQPNVLLAFIIFATSAQLRAQERDNGKPVDKGSSGSQFESAILCSEEGNCTCLFGELHVTVKCVSAGDRLDKIASKFPQATTHL